MSGDFMHYLKSVFEADLLDLFQENILTNTYAKNLMPFLSRTAASFRVSSHLLIPFTSIYTFDFICFGFEKLFTWTSKITMSATKEDSNFLSR